MKRVKFIVRDPDVNTVLGNEVVLSLDDDANIIDVIRKVDEFIMQKAGVFPVKGCSSLLSLVFHPLERRFYSHAALTAYSPTERFIDVRGDLDSPLPDGAVVILALTICGGDWEKIAGVQL